MAENSEKFVLAFDVEMQMKKAAKQVDAFSKQMSQLSKAPKKFKDAEKKAFVAFAKDVKDSTNGVKRIKKSLEMAGKEVLTGGLLGMKARKQFKLLEKDFDSVQGASKTLKETLKKHAKEVEALNDKMRKAKTTADRKAAQDELKAAQDVATEEIENARKVFKKRRAMLDKKMKTSGVAGTLEAHGAKAGAKADHAKKWAETMSGSFDDGASTLKKALEDSLGGTVARKMKGIGSSLFQKDLAGAIEGGGELAGELIFTGFQKGAKLANATAGKLGSKLAGAGANLGDKGKAKGGAGGIALQGMGGMMKGMGGMMKSIGPMLGMLAKIGPLLSTSAAIFAGLVKVMMDAESEAKQFNKDIMESASSAEILYNNGGDADKAFRAMRGTLDDVRDYATDIKENLKWGINKGDHKAMLNVMTQEGVTLDYLKKSYDQASNSSEKYNAVIQDQGDLVHMGIAYSRLFGTSLTEVSQMTAEMTTEMGMSLSGVALSYAKMTKDAADSGIAANKFFSIIRNVSSDLALYNTRLEQAASILKLLGKAMSPRNAAKFMQTLAKGQKEMSEEDRLKQTLIVGEGKMRDIVNDDIADKEKMLLSKMKDTAVLSAEDIKNGVTKESLGMEDALKRVPDAMKGEFSEAMAEIKMDKNEVKNGGVMGVANAAGNLSAAGAFTAKKAALQRFGGHKKLSEMSGIQGFAARKVTGTSMEEFRGMAKMEAAIDAQKDMMQKAMDAGANGDPAQQEIVKRLTALGITDKKQLAEASDAKVITAMDKSAQEALAASQEQTNYAQKTADLTSSISDKMDAIIDGIFEFLFVALKDIISDLNEFITMVADKFGKQRPEKEMKDNLRAVKNDKNEKLVHALQQAAGNTEGGGNAKTRMIDVLGPALDKGFDQALKGRHDEMISNTVDAATKANGGKLNDDQLKKVIADAEAGFKTMSVQQQLGQKNVDDLVNVTRNGLKGANGMTDPNRVNDAMGMTDIDAAKKKKFTDATTSGRGILGAVEDAGLTPDEVKKFMAKSMWAMKPEEIAKVMPTLNSTVDATNAHKNRPDAPAPPTSTGQAAATQKADGVPVGAPGAAAGASNVPFGPPAPPGAGAAGTPSAVVAGPPGAAPAALPGSKLGEKQLSMTSDLVDLNTDITKLLGGDGTGIKMNKSFLTSPYQKSMTEAVIDGTRKTLAENALYTSADPSKTLSNMKNSGFSGLEEFQDDKRYKDGFLTHSPANAAGGMVTGIQNGMAVVAAAGEGLTSIGKGERILPAHAAGTMGSGGGGGITLNVNGLGGNDLANYLRDVVSAAILQYKRKEKFT